MTAPCPVCGEPGGFHAPGPHSEAGKRIPKELLKDKDWLKDWLKASRGR